MLNLRRKLIMNPLAEKIIKIDENEFMQYGINPIG
jgi:hypothetical protein